MDIERGMDMCMDHIIELIIAIMPLLLALIGSHCKLNKEINSNNGDAAKLIAEMKKLIEAYKDVTRGN